jgi:EAL domain-containing protein (putative c-di-GMP-specific phosphodiesterase class I)
MHPQRGIVPPLEFLPVIENSEFSISLGEWVINEGLRQMNEWAANGIMLPVSVNISAKTLATQILSG